MTDPLETLLVNDADVARDELAAVLRPYVQLSRDGGVWLHDAFNALSTERRVLCLLLAAKAQSLLGLRDDDAIAPKDLIEMSNMPSGTVRPKLSALAKKRYVAKRGSAYFIPSAAARRAMAELSDG